MLTSVSMSFAYSTEMLSLINHVASVKWQCWMLMAILRPMPEFWKAGNRGTWKSGSLESQKYDLCFSESKSMSSRMLPKSGWVEPNNSRPHLRPFQAFFPWAGTIPKCIFFAIFFGGPMGPIHPVWASTAIHPRWGNRYHQMLYSDQQFNMWASHR